VKDLLYVYVKVCELTVLNVARDRYHPDKNPKTTPLFQAIQTASEKLSDPSQRRSAEEAAASAASKPSGFPPARPAAAASSKPTATQQPAHSSSSSSSAGGGGEKSSAYQQFMNQQRQRYGGGGSSGGGSEHAKPEMPPKPTRFPQPSSGFERKQKSSFNVNIFNFFY
jgi:curved DNA-binding protein CbpA